MQEIAKYILSQLPRLNDIELDQISSLATTIRVSRRVRTPHIDNPILTHGVGYAKGFPIIDELDELDEPAHITDAQDYALKQRSLEGDWVVRDEEPL